MKIFPLKLIALILIFLSLDVNSQTKLKSYDFPRPVDTSDREIKFQSKGIFEEQGVYVRNDFNSARMNGFKYVEANTYEVSISPENEPINDSPWYAFKIWADESREIQINLSYSLYNHRYVPKLSNDGESWKNLDQSKVKYNSDSTETYLSLNVSSDTLWIAGQEIQDSRRVRNWSMQLAQDKRVNLKSAGTSTKGRDLMVLDIGSSKNKETIVFLSRQHPPEVTGFLALKSFLDEVLNNSQSKKFLKRYRILVYPLLNPDGVDEGHWRHSTGGVDLNRDWAYYNQTEVRQVAEHIVKESKGNVVFGMDFHSTWFDIYYTYNPDSVSLNMPDLTRTWTSNIEDSIGEGFKTNVSESGIGSPTSSGWFATQFGAQAVTYEVGDETPRMFIDKKARVSAEELMKLLLKE